MVNMFGFLSLNSFIILFSLFLRATHFGYVETTSDQTNEVFQEPDKKHHEENQKTGGGVRGGGIRGSADKKNIIS